MSLAHGADKEVETDNLTMGIKLSEDICLEDGRSALAVRGDVIAGSFDMNGVMVVEAPVYLGQGRYDIGSIGAFTQINMRTDWDPSVWAYVEAESIGRYCSISHGVTIGLPGHAVSFLSTSTLFKYNGQSRKYFMPFIDNRDEGWESEKRRKNLEAWKKPLPVIGNDVWIGYGATVMNGVRISDGAVIGSGAVVTHNVPPYTVVAGCPARVVKERFSADIRKRLLRLKW